MKQKVNTEYKEIFSNKYRYIILMGGRGAGRSTVASQLALAKLVSGDYFRCAIMRYVLGDIRNSIYREILDRAEENEVKDSLDINTSTMTIKYGKNTINAVGFRKSSSDQKSKLKSLANYTTIIIEEADEIPEEDFIQLDDSLRTIKGNITLILLLNPPPKSHWVIKRWFDLLSSGVDNFYLPKLKDGIDDTLYIGTSYKDNIHNLDRQSIANYENYKTTRPDHYWNMVMGYVPEVIKGKIYKNWKIIDDIPHEAKLVRFGIDFGYSVDPTSIVAIYYYNGGYILDEIAYLKGLSNKNIADLLKEQPRAISIADSAEPKSIDEINSYGLPIIGAEKGADSIRNGIQLVQAQRISVTKHSVHVIKEYENYAWDVNKDGENLGKPKGLFDHSMDAIRYGLTSILRLGDSSEIVQKQKNRFQFNESNISLNSSQ